MPLFLHLIFSFIFLFPAAQAQGNYPQRPLKIIVPFTPGGSTDILARAIGAELTKSLGQAVVIENIAGVGGSIGADRVAKAAADGYTLLMGHVGTLAVNPALYPKLPYDPLKDFAAVAFVARVPNILVVHPSVAANQLAELLQQAKSKPDAFNYGSGGNGSAAHTATAYLLSQTNTPMKHVPYRGTAPAVTDLLAGHIQVLFTGAPAVLAHIKAGKMRPLAVSSPTRLSGLPQVPTVAESGLAGTAEFEADQWYGVVAPKGTPESVIKLLNSKINEALLSPEVKTRLLSEGAEPQTKSPQAFAALIQAEIKRWGPVIRQADIRPD
ncbi:MAG: hypothetical protein RLZZ502_816 [Pseudomonadota bacterium]|jgi:tripartite-type tricarboxylate transporter receptor subunit TctC